MILHWVGRKNMVSLPLARVVVSGEVKVTQRAFSIYKKIRKIYIGSLRLGRARSICHEFHSREPRNAWPLKRKNRERYGTSDKNNRDKKSANGTQIFHWEVSTGKTGLPFQKFRLFRKISSGTNQKVVFHLLPNRNFRNCLVNGKRL